MKILIILMKNPAFWAILESILQKTQNISVCWKFREKKLFDADDFNIIYYAANDFNIIYYAANVPSLCCLYLFSV
jgi:hypothetical protein